MRIAKDIRWSLSSAVLSRVHERAAFLAFGRQRFDIPCHPSRSGGAITQASAIARAPPLFARLEPVSVDIRTRSGLPTVLTTSMEDRIQGPLVPELNEILPDEFATRIKRPGIVRKKLFVAGITTEICVTFPVLQMLDEGYEVQVSADASASYTKYG
jgi:hypothetical protein